MVNIGSINRHLRATFLTYQSLLFFISESANKFKKLFNLTLRLSL